MPNRFELITSIYNEVRKDVVKSPQKWTAFLASACHNYRLPFDELLLIYAQRPDATAVLEINKWNSRFGRWVNGGARSIAVFDKASNKRQSLKYYFDISDTHETENSKAVPVWEMKSEYEQAVIESLENSYGKLKNKATLIDAVLSLADNITEDNISDYTDVLIEYKDATFLAELDDISVSSVYENLVKNSVAYMIATRLGINANDYFSREDFENIFNFNTDEAINAIGCAARDISEMAISEIAKTVIAIEKENRIIAKSDKAEYTESTKAKNEIERSNFYGRNHLQQTRTISDTQSDITEQSEYPIGKMVGNEENLSQKTQEESLYNTADNRQVGYSSERNPAESRTDGTKADERNGSTGRLDGGTQGTGYDDLGAGNEQSEKQSAGNNNERGNLQQVNDNSLPDFVDNDVILEIISNKDDNLQKNKTEIVDFFKSHLRDYDRIGFLKSIYPKRYTEIIYNNNRYGYVSQGNDGLLMWEGAYLSRTKESVFSWDVVSEIIKELIDNDEYLPKQKAEPAQFSLFNFNETFVNEPDVTADSQVSLFTDFGVSQQIIDEALCLGTHENGDILKIIAYLKKDKPVEKNARFIRKNYDDFSTGFISGGQKVAVSADDDGFRIAMGDNTQIKSITTVLSWKQVAKRIRELLDLGRYCPQFILDKVDSYERSKLADSIIYMARDIEDDYKDQFFYATMEAYRSNPGFPEASNALADKMSNPDDLETFIAEMSDYIKAITINPMISRFPRMYDPIKLLERLVDLQIQPLEFKAQAGVPTVPERFISEDEIRLLLRGSDSNSDYRLWMYSLYKTEPDKKKREKAIKDRYGIGGGMDTWHDGKGLTIKRGDIFEPYAKITLKWSNVEKRIGNMISRGTWLSEQDKEYMPVYEKKYIASQIGYFYRDIGNEHKKPFDLDNEHYWDSIDDVVVFLDDMDMVKSVYDDMLNILKDMNEGDRYYVTRHEAFEYLSAYYNGTFSFFGEKKEPKVILESDETALTEQSSADNKKGNISPLYQSYLDVKNNNQGNIIFYQVGDFYEVMGDDAATVANELDLVLTGRDVGSKGRIALCGFPVKSLEKHINTLTSLGYKITVSGIAKDDERIETTYTFDTNKIPVGRIDFYGSDGKVGYYIDYDNEADFLKTVQDCNYTGEPIGIVVYADKQGKHIATSFSNELDPLPKGFEIVPYEKAMLDRAKELIFKYYAEEFEDEFSSDFEDLSFIGLAVTDSEDGKHNIEAYANLIDNSINITVDTQLFEQRKYDTLTQLINKELYSLDFMDLTYLDEDKLKEIEKESSVPDVEVEKNQESKKEIERFSPPEAAPKIRENQYVFHPEISQDRKHNFNLADFEIQNAGAKERFRRNIDAINVLKECEFENRLATPDEQKILAKYVGWGGIPQAFDEHNDSWSEEFIELYTVLSPDEYETARASTLTAFYTPQNIISAVYKILDKLGFQKGNILEPSCAIGSFIGMLPEKMQESKVYGVELDSVSAKIARQLYQKSAIINSPFEKSNLPDSFFDVVIGNVPFGEFKVSDKKFDKYKYYIHDYFLAKSLDKVRSGGIVALITTKGTMDKKDTKLRKYIAQRADLIGAIRLPDNTFSGNAGTRITSDILVFQKRDRIIDIEPEWVQLDTDENGIVMNKYFVQHPEMILGNMVMESGRFKPESACKARKDIELDTLINNAVLNINGEITDYIIDDFDEVADETIPADPSVRNFSYTIVDGKIYYRENAIMKSVEVSETAENRIRGMIAIRDCVYRLIDAQVENYEDKYIEAEQETLNTLYDSFTKKYGLINNRGNNSAFSNDDSYYLLSALEIIEDGKLKKKADIFTKRTIKPHIPVEHADTANEALALSIGEKACVDMEYMSELTGKDENTLFNDLQGVVFLNPLKDNPNENKYLMADEYLSGNVREKLETAKKVAEIHPEYMVNVTALEQVQPKDLEAGEISVRLGATWISPSDINNFMYDLLNVSMNMRCYIKANFAEYSGEWFITNKSYDNTNVKVNTTYGTKRVSAFKIIETTLNLKDVRVFDYQLDEKGNNVAVLNVKETQIAQSKQELIKQAFKDWIWKEPERRHRLCKIYNERFNCIRPREYDGSHLIFSGINPSITLNPHQLNAVAHQIYGGNTLLAHCVGAGKSFEMIAAAMECKRLGLCTKSMFVVPNHLIEQWAGEFLRLYPSANILVTTKKDFQKANRKRFCSRIATGDYDAIIIGHSQFEKIPMSIERQIISLEKQRDDILLSIEQAKNQAGENFTIKQLEKARKDIQKRLEDMNSRERKDDVVTFESLGVDRLFIDESHYYKNLFLYTKMRNISGIAQSEAKKSSDLFMKSRYLDEITGGRGVVFATGTPVSNSMVELYTIQRYLQYSTLEKHHLTSFDAWASTFGETVTSLELKPEGTGYRPKTRFARFYNLPELMSMFKEVADIQTADMLNLPVPKAHFNTITTKPSDMQKKILESLAERAEAVREGNVEPYIDNILKITNDGRKLALDQRLINPLLPDFEGSKINACVDSIVDYYNKGAEKKLTQLVFCDLSTPKSDNDGNAFTDVYNDVRNKLILNGIPENEIAFIHNANTDARKAELFAKVRNGDVRILLGSTQKMGAGTNVQDRLLALHDLDCPWRPSDLEQRSGRIIRRGNMNEEVFINRYVTENTFDAYLYQIIETKQKFISQIYTSKSPARTAEDIDETALSYAEIKMLATGNPHIKEKMELDLAVTKLQMLKSAFQNEIYSLEDKIIKFYPSEISRLNAKINGLKKDIKTVSQYPASEGDNFVGMIIFDKQYTDKKEAGLALINACKAVTSNETIPLGEYRGFKMELSYDSFAREYKVHLKGEITHTVELGTSELGNITRLDNAFTEFHKELEKATIQLENTQKGLADAKIDVQRVFPQEEELKQKLSRLAELDVELKVNEKTNQVIDVEAPEYNAPAKKEKYIER